MARQTRRKSGKKRARKSNQQAGRLPRNAAPIEVSINHIGGRGDGVGKVLYTHNYNEAEQDIFVPASLPGERLLVQPLSLTAQGIKAQIIEIISPSPDRHEPRCDVFPACGGCRFQHWDETAIRNWKQSLVITFLNRSNVPIGDMRPFYSSPQKSRRRASFHLKCLADGAIVGFREYMGQHIIALHGCVVLHPALLDLQTKLQQFASAHFPAGFAADAHANLLDKHRSHPDDSNICLYLDPVSGAQPFSSNLLTKLADWAASINLARLSVNDHGSPMTLFAPEGPIVDFGKISVSPPPGAFLQATRDGEAMLQDSIAEIAGTDRHFVDFFAGCGTLSLPLLNQAASLLAVEQNEDSLAALRAGADAAGGLPAAGGGAGCPGRARQLQRLRHQRSERPPKPQRRLRALPLRCHAEPFMRAELRLWGRGGRLPDHPGDQADRGRGRAVLRVHRPLPGCRTPAR